MIDDTHHQHSDEYDRRRSWMITQAKIATSIKDNAGPMAVDIATRQGRVSIYRLSKQTNVSKGDARLALIRACNEGHIYLAQDGRDCLANRLPG